MGETPDSKTSQVRNDPTQACPDEELFRRYAAYPSGDEEAFTELFGRYSSRLYLFLKVRLGKSKAHLAEELFQKTWLKVHQSRRSFDSSRRFSTWFYTLALNTLRDEVGRKAESAVHEELSTELADTRPSAEEKEIQKDLIAKVLSYLPELPPNQRTAFLLSDEEGLSSQEVAEVMHISDASARQLISRSRRAIRDKFKSEGL